MKKKTRLLPAAAIFIGVLCLWTYRAASGEHYTPDYAKKDLKPYLEKDVLTEADYKLLFEQTGLAKAGVDELLIKGEKEELLYLQERFFAEVEVECENSWLLYNESIAGYEEEFQPDAGSFLPVVEDGDILITFSSHFLGWRNGHAALVVDAGEGLTLEARNMGSDSALMYLSGWERRPSFVLLRLKDASRETRAEIAGYAREHLVGIPYQLTALAVVQDESGMTQQAAMETTGMQEVSAKTRNVSTQTSEGSEALPGTQCAHLVWYAYQVCGYNLQAGEGHIVTPYQLLQSPLLEVIQVYGLEI